MKIRKTIKIAYNNYKWRKKNKNNFTRVVNDFNIGNVNVGANTYGDLYVLNYGEGEILSIGACCSIGPNVTFVLNADHVLSHVSTYPYKVKMLKNASFEAISKGNITIGDDVWIGCNATILSGVKIGRGAVIGAGAVVNTDIPPYAIAVGVPAKVVRYRFADNIIEEMMKIDFNKFDYSLVAVHEKELYTDISMSNYNDIINSICNDL